MTRLQTALLKACKELDLDIHAPYTIDAGITKRVTAQALLPQLGAPRGMVVVNCYDDLHGMSDELVNNGYGYSVLDNPLPAEDFNIDSYIELFCDWGWAVVGEQPPDWVDCGS